MAQRGLVMGQKLGGDKCPRPDLLEELCMCLLVVWSKITILELWLSFYRHLNISDAYFNLTPDISDIVVDPTMWRTKWTINISLLYIVGNVHIVWTYTSKKSGPIELYLLCQIFNSGIWCRDIWKTIFGILEVQFHYERGLSESRYFELFCSAWLLFSPCKKSALTEAPFSLFWTLTMILRIFAF